MLLLSNSLDEVNSCCDRAKRLFPRVLALEHLLANSDDGRVLEQLRAFDAGYFWRDHNIFRETCARLLQNNWRLTADVREDMLRLFASLFHERGMENVFRSLRRVVRKGENRTVNIERLSSVMRAASSVAFPNVAQDLAIRSMIGA